MKEITEASASVGLFLATAVQFDDQLELKNANRLNAKWIKFQKYASCSYFIATQDYVSKANKSKETCIPMNES